MSIYNNLSKALKNLKTKYETIFKFRIILYRYYKHHKLKSSLSISSSLSILFNISLIYNNNTISFSSKILMRNPF